MTEVQDDDLVDFAAKGAWPLPAAHQEGHVRNDGANIWYAAFGSGDPVILLHGGLGHSGDWGYQVPVLVDHGHRVIVIDSRGHGRSTRDSRPFSYQQMASDVLAVMNALSIARASFVGWSDGAVVALALAKDTPARASRVFFFACNVDPTGAKDFRMTPVIERCLSRHAKDYAELSDTPNDFDALMTAVSKMQRTQPNYGSDDLNGIHVPVTSALSQQDEFIQLEHAQYLASALPEARFVELHHVTHFAPVQRPGVFNQAVLDFLASGTAP